MNPAATIAIRSSCSWNSGTPSVRARIGSSDGCGYAHRLAPGAPLQIRMHHLPDDRPGPDDRHLDDEVVEASRACSRGSVAICARDSTWKTPIVSASCSMLVDGRIVRRQMREIDDRTLDRGAREVARSACRLCVLAVSASIVVSPFTSVERVLQHRHHAEAEQIDLDDPHVGAVVLVPLHDDAAGHAGVLERHDGVELALADHHAAGMLAEMPRQILHLAPEPREQPDALGVRASRPTAAQVARQRVGRIDELEVVHHLREPIDLRRLERRAPSRLRAPRCGRDR